MFQHRKIDNFNTYDEDIPLRECNRTGNSGGTGISRYVKELKKGLVSCESMKETVQFLLEQFKKNIYSKRNK